MEINPCPKCGRMPKTETHDGLLVTKPEIRCDSCGLSTKRCLSVMGAVRKWNEMTNNFPVRGE